MVLIDTVRHDLRPLNAAMQKSVLVRVIGTKPGWSKLKRE